jgi:hypothetical protein
MFETQKIGAPNGIAASAVFLSFTLLAYFGRAKRGGPSGP